MIEDLEPKESNQPEESNSQPELSRRDFLKLSALLPFAAKIPKFLLDPVQDLTDNSFEEVAQSYIANTHEKATEVACHLRGPQSSPSNICGPLAMAIALGWKLNPDGTMSNVSDNGTNHNRAEGIAPEEMWLGSPTNDPERYKTAFPEEKYDSFHVKENIGTLDFNNIPEGVGELKPGDFLYLDGGSFTHYITVSRRDADGRIYCVSNIPSETNKDEFTIKEVMLWDPVKKDGFFRSWAKGVGVEGARTGLKGLYLWRRKAETERILDDPISQKYRDILLNEMRDMKEGEWEVYMHEIGAGDLFEWRDGVDYHAASTIKVPLAIVAMKAIKEAYREEIIGKGLKYVLENMGVDDRSFNQLISAMLVKSEEDATKSLANFAKSVESTRDLKKEFEELGMHRTWYEPRRTTQKDLFECWRGLLLERVVDDETGRYLLGKLGEYTKNDDTLIGEVRNRIPGARHWKQWNKRGAITNNPVTVQDSGILEIPTSRGSRYFYIGIAGTSTDLKKISYEDAEKYITKIMGIFSDYILESEEGRTIKSNREVR